MLDFSDATSRQVVFRDYQAADLEKARQHIREGRKRIIFAAGTGYGKGEVAIGLMQESRKKGAPSLFVVDRVSLIDQMSSRFDKYGIPHGVIQSNNPRYDPYELVQIASIQTLANRGLALEPRLICWDEAHVQYGKLYKRLDQWPDAVRIGFTATPFAKGMADHWDDLVPCKTTKELVSEGTLIEPIIYEALTPDQAKIKLTSSGEYDAASSADAGITIVGDVVAEWREKTTRHFGGPVKTVVFASTVDHGQELCQAFARSGHRFEQISYHDKDDDARRAKIREFIGDGGLDVPEGGIVGLVSCGVLTRGFDVPSVRCGISCRPYRKSLSSHMQEIGRVMRPMEGKGPGQAIWLCHTGNVGRLQAECFEVWDEGPPPLSSAAKKDSMARKDPDEKETKEARACPKCEALMRGPSCPSCGYHRPVDSGLVVEAGSLHLVERAVGPCLANARKGLRAPVLNKPVEVWSACISYARQDDRTGDAVKVEKRALAMWRGIYPTSWPIGPRGARRESGFGQDAMGLVEREQKAWWKSRRKGR